MLSEKALEMKNRIDFSKDVFKIFNDVIEIQIQSAGKMFKEGKPSKMSMDELTQKLGVSKETIYYAIAFHKLLILMQNLYPFLQKDKGNNGTLTSQEIAFETLALQSRLNAMVGSPPMQEDFTLSNEIVVEQFLSELDDDGLFMLSIIAQRKDN